MLDVVLGESKNTIVFVAAPLLLFCVPPVRPWKPPLSLVVPIFVEPRKSLSTNIVVPNWIVIFAVTKILLLDDCGVIESVNGKSRNELWVLNQCQARLGTT